MTGRPGTVGFHRPARVQPAPIVSEVATISSPPTVPEPAGNAVWQVLAPALGSAGMLGFAIALGEPRYMVMAGVIAGVMLASGVTSRVVAARSNRKRRASLAARYRSHLDDVRARVERGAALQRTAAEGAHPSLFELPPLVRDGTRTWERRSHHGDFLTVRLGTGTVPAALTPRLELQSDPMAEPEPELLDDARTLEDTTSRLTGVPISVDLGGAGCVAIVGDRVIGRHLASSLVAQFAALRSPADLAIAAHVAPEDHAVWDWVKWLPHVRAGQSSSDDGRTLVSSSAAELDVMLDQLASQRLDALEHRRAAHLDSGPLPFRQVVVVIDGYTPDSDVGRLERLDTMLAAAGEIGVLVVVIVDHPDDVPSNATATVAVDVSGTLGFSETRPDGLRIGAITPDGFDEAACESLARALAPLRSRSNTTPAALDSSGLLELLGEHADTFDPQRTWAADTRPLSTPIGLGPGGEPLVLDIRESAVGGMGPHGILIGATGSGKSELLRTLVLGLAARNSSDELNLVLADFKGGATFAGLERLPHTAGMISNLESDPTLVDRMQEAIYGEMERRQRILRDTGFDRADEYRRHRRIDPESRLDSLPALLVVVDEFGELLATQPEFADLFTSIGRTGRSLGVHLLLSSQRLDEGRIRRVESHLRYRICLRTFTPEESVSVIGSRASFDLPPIPGLGHLSVDSGLTQFKAGLVNRPIRSAVRAESQTGTIRRFDISGPATTLGDVSPASSRPASSTTEMQLFIERIEMIGRPARPVWLSPLPDAVEFVETATAAPLEIAIGVTDLPRQQQQPAAMLDFSGTAGNLAVVGGPRSGKSTMLASLITAFAGHASPEDISFYGIDLGGGTLHHLEALPHVGSVFGRSHREEIPRLVRQLHTLVEHRIDQFRNHGITSVDDFRRARSSGRIESAWGEVFLIIDNWGLFSHEFGIELSDLVGEIVSSGLHYGVHVILSAGRWQDIRISMRDNIGGRFELRLADPIESEIDRHASRQLPCDVPGRAIDAAGRQTQVMKPAPDLGSIIARWSAAPAAPPVRMLPSLVTEDDLIGASPGRVGIAEHDLGGWAPDLFGGDPHFIVLGDGGCGKTTMLRGLIRGVGPSGTVRIGVVDYRRRLRSEMPAHQCLGYATTPEEAATLAARILVEVASRTATDAEPTPERPEVVLIIDDYDLVGGSTTNPIGPLVDLVPRGSDLGFHLVVARKVAGVARTSFEPVFQRLREAGTPTLVMDGDPGEGPVVGTVRAVRRQPGRGLVVSRSRSQLVQVARFEPVARVHALAREESA